MNIPFFQAFLPATGENTNWTPYIIAGLGLLVVAGFVLLTIADRKRNAAKQPEPAPEADSADPVDQQEEPVTQETDSVSQDEPVDQVDDGGDPE
ncbi:MAG: LPXTG cell wall anchor domain-containing protein [Oscillospiraceae bacterium]|nr:LPXTG cell wall anchor domain-containing protein [Oscillospiraceae bacterium]